MLQFIVEGSARGLWAFRDRASNPSIIEDYELSYLTAQAKAPPSKDGPQAKVAVAKAAGAAPQPAAAPAGQPKPAQQTSLPAPVPGQKMLPQPAMAGPQPQQQQQKLAQAAGPQQQQPAPNPQWVSASAGNSQPMQLPPAPQIIVQPRTLEDEVPIAVR